MMEPEQILRSIVALLTVDQPPPTTRESVRADCGNREEQQRLCSILRSHSKDGTTLRIPSLAKPHHERENGGISTFVVQELMKQGRLLPPQKSPSNHKPSLLPRRLLRCPTVDRLFSHPLSVTVKREKPSQNDASSTLSDVTMQSLINEFKSSMDQTLNYSITPDGDDTILMAPQNLHNNIKQSAQRMLDHRIRKYLTTLVSKSVKTNNGRLKPHVARILATKTMDKSEIKSQDGSVPEHKSITTAAQSNDTANDNINNQTSRKKSPPEISEKQKKDDVCEALFMMREGKHLNQKAGSDDNHGLQNTNIKKNVQTRRSYLFKMKRKSGSEKSDKEGNDGSKPNVKQEAKREVDKIVPLKYNVQETEEKEQPCITCITESCETSFTIPLVSESTIRNLDRGDYASTNDSEVILPVKFSATMKASLGKLTESTKMEISTLGTIQGLFTTESSKHMLTKVSICLDIDSLVKSLDMQVKCAVKNAVKYAMTQMKILPKPIRKDATDSLSLPPQKLNNTSIPSDIIAQCGMTPIQPNYNLMGHQQQQQPNQDQINQANIQSTVIPSEPLTLNSSNPTDVLQSRKRTNEMMRTSPSLTEFDNFSAARSFRSLSLDHSLSSLAEIPDLSSTNNQGSFGMMNGSQVALQSAMDQNKAHNGVLNPFLGNTIGQADQEQNNNNLRPRSSAKATAAEAVRLAELEVFEHLQRRSRSNSLVKPAEEIRIHDFDNHGVKRRRSSGQSSSVMSAAEAVRLAEFENSLRPRNSRQNSPIASAAEAIRLADLDNSLMDLRKRGSGQSYSMLSAAETVRLAELESLSGRRRSSGQSSMIAAAETVRLAELENMVRRRSSGQNSLAAAAEAVRIADLENSIDMSRHNRAQNNMTTAASEAVRLAELESLRRGGNSGQNHSMMSTADAIRLADLENSVMDMRRNGNQNNIMTTPAEARRSTDSLNTTLSAAEAAGRLNGIETSLARRMGYDVSSSMVNPTEGLMYGQNYQPHSLNEVMGLHGNDALQSDAVLKALEQIRQHDALALRNPYATSGVNEGMNEYNMMGRFDQAGLLRQQHENSQNIYPSSGSYPAMNGRFNM